jgi:rhodanese-related sulfurtransferase
MVRDQAEFRARAEASDIELPEHLTEALRINRSGARPVDDMIREAGRSIAFASLGELRAQVDDRRRDLIIVDIREGEAFRRGHVPGARNIPRGQLELVADRAFPNPDVRILTYCEFGRISTLAAATLRQMGFAFAVALDGGFREWVVAGHPVERSRDRGEEQ